MGDVFLFGAGASMEYRGNHIPPPPRPLFCDDGFFPVIAELDEKWSIRDGEDRRPEHYDGTRWDWPTLQGLIDASGGMATTPGLEAAFSAVSAGGREGADLFCRAIELALFWRIRGTGLDQFPVHVMFLKRVLRPGATLITFNYDPILEFALEHVADEAGVRWSPRDGYGFPFERQLSRDGGLGLVPDIGPSNVTLLKLHGSMNWLVGVDQWPSPPELLLRLQTYGGPGCPCVREPGGRVLRPVFVPPEPRKDYVPFGLHALWQQAEEALAKADSLHVIGYSFPKTDTRARQLMDIVSARLGNSDDVTFVDRRSNVWPDLTERFPRARRFTQGFAAYVIELLAS